jgi:hypothetical protein
MLHRSFRMRTLIAFIVLVVSLTCITLGGVYIGIGCNPNYPELCSAKHGLQTQVLTNITTGTKPCTSGSLFQCDFVSYNFQTCTYETDSDKSFHIGTSYPVYVDSPGICIPAQVQTTPTQVTNAGIGLLATGGFLTILAIFVYCCECVRRVNRTPEQRLVTSTRNFSNT